MKLNRDWTLRCLLLSTIAAGAAHAGSRVIVKADQPPALAKATRLSATALDISTTVVLILPLRDPAGAARFAQRVSTPGDSLHGQYLTPTQFAERFGAPQVNYDAVAAWAQTQGLTVQARSAGRTILAVSGTVAQIEAAFGVQIDDYKGANGRVFHAAVSAPSLPTEVAGFVSGVVGLSDAVQFAPLVRVRPAGFKQAPATAGSGPGGGYAAAELRTAYSVPQPSPDTPTEVAAVFEQGGFAPGDVAQYVKFNKLTAVPVKVRSVDNYSGGIDDPGVELESILDIDMLIGINPGLKEVLVYEDGETFSVSLLDSLAAMADDDIARTISISYGVDEAEAGDTMMAAEAPLFQQMAAQGQTVLVSSGDDGAYGREGFSYNAPDPGAQPFVTSVGGNSLYTGPGGSYYGENAWNDLGINDGATGGGVSAYWSLPSYQLVTGSTTTAQASYNGGSNTMRNFPDVSAVGNPLTGVSVYSQLYGGWLTVGGTSASSPIYAGVLTHLDKLYRTAGLPHVGFYNPALYALGETIAGYYSFHDVRDGTNGNPNENDGLPGYSAGYNLDNVSGWGSPNAIPMLTLLFENIAGYAGQPADAEDINGTVTATSATISWKPAAGVNGYELLAVDPFTGASLTFAVTKGRSATLSGLAPNSLYEFLVESLTPTGTSYGAPLYLTTAKK